MKCPKCKADNPNDSRFCNKCGNPLIDTPSSPASLSIKKPPKKSNLDFAPGQYFSKRYQIIEEIGRGGMGLVYKAIDKELDRIVALKMIKPEIISEPDTVERFKKEIKLASQITHEYVCRIHDLGEVEGIKYISMQFIEGQNLREFIHTSKRLSIDTAINIAEQICQALTAAHKKGIIHRDLKPHNIMLDKKGNAYVMDFGLARSLEAKEVTRTGVVVGTPHYMSPEQGKGKTVDIRTDIYSLGCILYEMLTGKPPFEANISAALIHKHIKEIPQPPSKLNPQISPTLNRITLKCLEKDPEKRYQEVKALHCELRNIEKDIPTIAEVPPEEKPITPKEITVTFSLKKLFIPSLITIALIAAAIIIWRLVFRKEPASVPTGKPSLAVMYFKNNTGEENLDHWSSALSDLLIADLSQSKHLKVLSGEKLFNILRKMDLLKEKSYSSEDVKEVAAQGRVEHILLGNYSKAGNTFRINITLQQASTGELIGSEGVEGRGEESIFTMVDELTKRIKNNFKFSEEQIAGDIDREVGKITTSSPEAYKYYSEGRKYHNQGNYRKSIEMMEKAVAIDPEFAMAYRAMAGSYNNLHYSSESLKYSQKALALTDRVSDRERYIIQGGYYLNKSEKTLDKAIEAYKKLLQLYPDDRTGNNNLGLIYTRTEQWDKATKRFAVNMRNNDEAFMTYLNIADAYMYRGLYNKAQEVLEYYLNNFPDNANIHSDLALNYLYQGKYELALVEVDRFNTLDSDNYLSILTQGIIYHCMGDMIKAEKEYQKLLNNKEQSVHLFSRCMLGYLYLQQRRFDKSKEQIKEGINLSIKLNHKGWESYLNLLLAYINLKLGDSEEALQECDHAINSAIEGERWDWLQRLALHCKGLIYLEMNSMDDAQKSADELKEIIDQGMTKKAIRLHYHLMGMMELKNNNFSKSIEYFKKAISLLPSQSYIFDNHAIFIDSLASAYYQAGDINKAQKEYEKIIFLTSGRLFYGDLYVKSFYMLGRIYQHKGWEGKSIEHYEKFLELWKYADPNVPEIIDAKKQLVILQIQ